MVKLVGDIAFVLAAIALFLFSVAYMTSVRWWTDRLGLAIAGVVGTVGTIVCVATMVLLGVPVPGLPWVRAVLYPALALTSWGALIAFIWAQFGSLRRSRLPSTRPNNSRKGMDHGEKDRLAGHRPDCHGDPDDSSGSPA